MDGDSTVEGSSCKIYALAVVERLPGKDQREREEERDRLFDGRRGYGRGIRNLESSKNPEKVQQSFSRLSQIAKPVSLRERERERALHILADMSTTP